MTVDAAVKMWSRDSSDFEVVEGSRLRIAIREAYTVTHTVDATPLEIINASGLPAANSTYPGTSFVFCNTARPQRISPIMSIVEIAYAGENDANDPEIEYTDTDQEHPIDEDYYGNPIVTANGEPIYGVTTTIADPVLNVRRKFLTFNQYLTAVYRQSTNSDTFNGWPAGTARMTRFNAKRVGSLVNGYWDVSATITFRVPYRTTAAYAWDARVRHEGYYEKKNGVVRRAADESGAPMIRPVLLRSDGTRETNAANALWIPFKRYGSLPYNALGLL